jgi:flagellar biosynthetic protein FlhB
MADAQDRHLPASERRLRKAREDGQVPRSRDLSHFAVVAVGGTLLAVAAPTATRWLRDWLESALRFDAALLARPDALTRRLGELALAAAWPVIVFGALVVALVVLAAVASGGWNFTLAPLQVKLQRLDPLAGLGRMFSRAHLGDTLKACGLATLLGAVGAFWLRAHLAAFHDALRLPLPDALAHTGQALRDGLALPGLLLALFAAVDVPLQRTLWRSRLKMSTQEAKQEHKDAEGNIEVKGKIKARMREMARRRMLAAVPKADLVVMNPTHYAVALTYDEAAMAAPRVVAKGADLLALKIRDVARDAGVPVLQAAPLARALYAHTELDQEVPAKLFSAVAQVLAYVYQLRAALAGRGAMPRELPEIAVPPEMDPAAA